MQQPVAEFKRLWTTKITSHECKRNENFFEERKFVSGELDKITESEEIFTKRFGREYRGGPDEDQVVNCSEKFSKNEDNRKVL